MATSKNEPSDQKLNRPVRLKDIAEVAGVSISAVSHVLMGTGQETVRVGAEKAAYIRDVAERLQFYPSYAAQQLRGRPSGVIGALASDWFSQLPLRVLSWLNHRGAAHGYATLASPSAKGIDSMREHLGKCRSWNVDGLIFLAYDNDACWPEVVPLLKPFPRVVSLLGNPYIPGATCVESDVADGVRQAVAHLHAQGRRKIVQILEDVTGQSNARRQQAFCDAHRAADRPMAADQVCEATRGFEADDFPKFLELCDDLITNRHADAILADSDYTAAGLIKALQYRGRRVPDDVAVVGWGNEALAAWFIPRLTTVSYLLDEVVGTAIHTLTEMIKDRHVDGGQVISIKPKLMLRESA